MKNIIKYVLIFVIGGLVLSSCEDLESNYAAMTNDYDKSNTTYYIQYLNATQRFDTEIDEAGQPTDIVTTVGVALLGAPQTSDITVTIIIDPSSTLTSDMYTLSATSITIPAGANSGSVSLIASADQMPEDEVLDLVLNMDAGGAEAATASQINYSMKRMKFCPWTVDDMVGTYTGTDAGLYSGGMTEGVKFEVFKVDDTHIAIAGMGSHQWGEWGETITDGDRVEMEVLPNGTLTFENQYLCTTDDVWVYYMGPSDEIPKWDGCTMSFNIPWYFHWDTDYADNMWSESIFTKN